MPESDERHDLALELAQGGIRTARGIVAARNENATAV